MIFGSGETTTRIVDDGGNDSDEDRNESMILEDCGTLYMVPYTYFNVLGRGHATAGSTRLLSWDL